jgi:hypothetical protein
MARNTNCELVETLEKAKKIVISVNYS